MFGKRSLKLTGLRLTWFTILLAQNVFAAPSGVDLFVAGNYEQAIPALYTELQSSPNDTDTLYLIGVAYQRLEQNGEAIGALRRVLNLDPNFLDAHLPLGIAYSNSELPESALPHLESALKYEPSNGSAWLFLGLTQSALGEYRDAITSFDKATSLDADLEQSALFNRAVAERNLGQERISQQSLRNAIDVNPGSDLASATQGLLIDVPPPVAEPKRFNFTARAGVEYDDNVTNDVNDVTTGVADEAGIFEVSAAYQLVNSDEAELELGYDFYQSLYTDLDDFDLQLHTLYAVGSYVLGQSDVGGAYRFTDVSLGGEDFLDIHSVTPNIGFSLNEAFYHSITYGYQHKNFAVDNDRDANQHSIALDNYYIANERTFTTLSLRYEDENTDGPQFDYQAVYASVGFSSAVNIVANHPTRIRFSYQYFLRDYENITPAIGRDRRDQRHTVSIGVRQPLTKHFAALLNYQYLDADSNLRSADFAENILSLSMEFAY